MVATFSWNAWLSVTIHLVHMCGALPSPQCWVKQILVLAVIIFNMSVVGGGGGERGRLTSIAAI